MNLFLGLVMLPSTILSYIQMAQFLMLVMFVSWVYSTFFFLPLCAVIGPVGTTCQLTFKKMKSARASFRSNSRDRIEMEPVPTNHTAGGVYYGPTEWPVATEHMLTTQPVFTTEKKWLTPSDWLPPSECSPKTGKGGRIRLKGLLICLQSSVFFNRLPLMNQGEYNEEEEL